MTHSFHSRVLLIVVGLVVLALAGTTTGMYVAASRTAHGLAEQQLAITERLVQDALGARDHEYRTTLLALAADFAFRDAVSSHDAATIASALANHGARVGADLAVLLNGAGKVIASTDASVSASSAMTPLLDSARNASLAPVVVNVEGRLLQLVVVPVRAPDTVGWVGMGFVLRDFVVDGIKAISGADITLLAQNGAGPPLPAASTIAPAQRAALGGQVEALLNGGMNARVIELREKKFLTKVVAVSGGAGPPFLAILQLPENAVTAPLQALREGLLRWMGPMAILCLLAAMMGARFLALPIQALATSARNLHAPTGAGDARADDISSLAGAFHALAHRTQYDALTGLPNRTLFAEWLSAAISRAEREKTPLAVVFVDLDGFRSINDSLGRAMGDLVLRKTAQRLLRCMRTSDVVARLDADQFVLILDGVSQTGALQIVHRLMPVIAKPMESPGGPIRVSMRAGIAVYPDHAGDRESLLSLADAARHESKTRKQSTVIAKAPPDASPTMSLSSLSVSSIRAMSASDTWSGAPWQGDDLATQPMRKIEAEDTP